MFTRLGFLFTRKRCCPLLLSCCPLLLGISKVLKNNIERTNHYAIKTLLNLGNSATYDFCLAMADMDKLEQRRTLQSLILFFKCFKLDGPNYISQFFTPRLTKYNLRDNGLNVVQPPYNSLVMHNSYLYMIAHIWNQLPTATKSSSTSAQFRRDGSKYSGGRAGRGVARYAHFFSSLTGLSDGKVILLS